MCVCVFTKVGMDKKKIQSMTRLAGEDMYAKQWKESVIW